MKQYFATLELADLLPALDKRIKGFNNYIEGTGLARRWARSERLYFGKHQGEQGVGSYTIKDAGVDGEMSALQVNKYRNLIKHNLSYTVTQKPAWDPRAKNSDTKSQQQARLASNILDSYMTEKRMGRHMNAAAERALVDGKGFVHQVWNPALGKPIPMMGVGAGAKKAYEGDIECTTLGPFDHIYDPMLRDHGKRPWEIDRLFENKWDLAARHPDKAEEIISLTAQDDLETDMRRSARMQYGQEGENDIIPVYHFYHKKTDGVPTGRYTKFLNAKIGLYDGGIQYSRLPTFRIAPGDEFDTAEGYTDAFDQMMLQEAMNILYSVGFSNMQSFSGQKLWLPEGCELDSSMLDDGITVLRGGALGTEPKILNLTGIPKEWQPMIELIGKTMVEGMGLNSVVTGDPEHGLKSGTALGRMQAMAIQYASNFQRSWAELQEDVGTNTVDLLKQFASTKRMIGLAGVANKGAMESFTKDDLQLVERVGVNLGNPAFRTAAGVMELAENLFQKGECTGREYIQVIQTGSLECLMEQKETDPDLVQKENELLRDGKPVRAMVGDAHMYHMDKHRAVLADPTLRTQAAQGDQMAIQIIEATAAHIMEHDQIYSTQAPIFSVICKEPPAPQPMMPQPMPGAGPEGAPPPPPEGGPPMSAEGPPAGPAAPPPIPPAGAVA